MCMAQFLSEMRKSIIILKLIGTNLRQLASTDEIFCGVFIGAFSRFLNFKNVYFYYFYHFRVNFLQVVYNLALALVIK